MLATRYDQKELERYRQLNDIILDPVEAEALSVKIPADCSSPAQLAGVGDQIAPAGSSTYMLCSI